MKKTLIAVATLVIVLITIYGYTVYLQQPSISLDQIEVLQEDNTSVVVRYDQKTGKLYKSFADDFSDPNFLEWFSEDRWTTINTMSPATPSLDDFVDLRKQVLSGKKDFEDNRIEAVDGVAKFTAVAPEEGMATSKAMLEQNRLWFLKGDDLWFRGRYFLKQGVPFTIVDFQERGRYQSPGPRITIWDQKYLGYELKSGWKPRLKQQQVEIPLQQWFEITVHLKLDETNGQVQIWQDGQLIIDDQVATLPAADSLLGALEVGITATDMACEVLVDEIKISHETFDQPSEEQP